MAFAVALATWLSFSESRHSAGAGRPSPSKEMRHRLTTKRGPVYVYRPAGVSPVFTVVYVHGFYNTVDTAWKEHDLADKFAHSQLHATFVVPEAPAAAQEAVVWPDLEELLSTVRASKPKAFPRGGPIVLVGHSAAYRTMVGWLKHPRVKEVFLVDALYGFEDEYASWVKQSGDHRMVLVVKTTAEWATPFLKRFRAAIKLNEIPNTPTSRLRHAHLVAMNTALDHMALVKDPQPLVGLLRLSRYAQPLKKAPAAPKASLKDDTSAKR